MVPFLVIIFILVLSMNPEVTSKPSDLCPQIDTNGCSVPFDLPAPYEKTLTPACEKHDIYYTCGEKYGWNQKQCDQAFKSDMYKLCEKRSRKRWFFPSIGSLLDKVNRCKRIGANKYYNTVVTFGRFYWVKNPPSSCNALCAKEGHPNKRLEV